VQHDPKASAGPVALVVGASRGIGLALTSAELAKPGAGTVIATHREDSDLSGLEALARKAGGQLTLHELEVTNERSLKRFSEYIACWKQGIDQIIVASGILHEADIRPEKSLSRCRPDDLLRMFEVNSIGPLMVARALIPLQPRNKPFTFAALSAMVGSIDDNRLGGWYGYRASKAALNQFIRTLAIECRVSHPHAKIVVLHPGTTDTDLSRPFQRNIPPGRLYSPELTACRLLQVIGRSAAEDSGRFLNWDGSPIPW
jgi:NAD(P)-dependent dehydrogenase (short-subunit alcohol dehydrogenase family)